MKVDIGKGHVQNCCSFPTDRPLPRRARPKPKDMPRYTSATQRGHLAATVQLRNYKIAQQLIDMQVPAVDLDSEREGGERVDITGVWWDANAGRAVFGPSRDRAY